MPAPQDAVGIGADTAQLLAGGAFSAGAREYLRPASKWKQAILATGLCVGGAYLFGPFVQKLIHGLSGADLPPTVAGAVAGLACIGVAEGILTAADRLDLSLWSPFTRRPVITPVISPAPVPTPASPPIPLPPASPVAPEHHHD